MPNLIVGFEAGWTIRDQKARLHSPSGYDSNEIFEARCNYWNYLTAMSQNNFQWNLIDSEHHWEEPFVLPIAVCVPSFSQEP